MRVYRMGDFIKQGNIHISGHVDDVREPIHTHDFIEIVYILSGKITQVIDTEEYEVTRGDILFMTPECTHSFESNGKYAYVNILFSPSFEGKNEGDISYMFSLSSLSIFNEMCSDAGFGKISFSGKERDDIENIISDMLTEYKNKDLSWETVLGNHLSTLIVKMLRKTQSGVDPDEIDGMWRDLSEYIDKNLENKLTLDTLAKKCFYNPSYFSRVFKERFSMTLTEYLTRKRIDHAKELLRNSTLSVDEISTKVGFSDRVSMYHAFSRYLGSSPLGYRRDNKKE